MELASPSDEGPRGLTALRQKMERYRANGAQLGWLLIPEEQAVEIFTATEAAPQRPEWGVEAQPMVVSPFQQRIWRQRRQEATALAEARERAALRLAPEAAALLRQGWPGIEGIWMSGSVAEGRTYSSSDIDLAGAGLPLEVLLTATAELNSLATSCQDPATPIDLVRLESLPPHWQQRIRERGIVL